MNVATRASWQTQPLPKRRKQIEFAHKFTLTDFKRVIAGHIPGGMDDRWFILFEAGWLYFYRSWTGFCIYGVRLDVTPDGFRAAVAWVNADEEQYRSGGDQADRRIIAELIDSHLLMPDDDGLPQAFL